ncbi:Uncharacterised protein [uncultured Flavonifractor sp.]|nr:Uncharacterised protein [uncultured Flavonifractor sp.]
MNHQYSRFKKKNIPYAKVGRRVFINLFNAETFCSKHGLDMDSAIEYGENTELKRKVEEIAKYQKPILREVIERLENRCAVLHEEIKRLSDSLENCHPLDRGFLEDQLNKAISKNDGTHEAKEIVWDLLEELERLTGWHD